MSCVTPEQLAAAAAGEDPEALVHAAACAACRELLDEQRAVRELLGLVVAVPLTRARREELTAEVLARADALPRHRRGRLVVLGSFGVIAAAAAIVLIVAVRDRPGHRDRPALAESGTPAAVSGAPAVAGSRTPDTGSGTPDVQTPDSQTPDGDRTPDKNRAPRTRAATVVASTNGQTPQFTRALQAGRDIVDLVEGAITIDARNAAPIHVVATDSAARSEVGVRVVKGKIAVKARRGVIESVTVFAGSAEITSEGRRHVIEAGTVWDAARDGAAVTNPAVGAFREGWTALRAGHYAMAMAAFDRATDPSIAEDAAYWAAIAAERMGDRSEAARRFTAFLANFPQSGRAAAARLAREKLVR